MFLAIAIVATLVLFGVTLFVREKDLPEPVPVLPYHHLETRKATIYENLRDLQFEYRVGKLSDDDYQRTKLDLQKELAVVLAEIDQMKAASSTAKPSAGPRAGKAQKSAEEATVCPHCGAKFDKPLKFCGECGKAMGAQA
jgi:hypothetical protein